MKNYEQDRLHKILLIVPPYLWFFIFLLLPLLLICAVSLSEYSSGVPPFKLFFFKDVTNKWIINPSIENFKILIQDKFYIRSYLLSIKLALITTLCTLLLGYPIAVAIVNSAKSIKNILLLLIVLPFWTSLVIRAYAWNTILGDAGIINKFLLYLNIIEEPVQLLNSQFATILGMVYCYLPFMVLPLFIAIDKIDKSITEASLDLGCTPLASFFRITLPLSTSGIIAGSMLVFIPSIGEFIIPDLLGGNKVLTVGKVIWNEFFYNRDWPVSSAITIVLTLTFMIPVMIVQRIVSNREESNE